MMTIRIIDITTLTKDPTTENAIRPSLADCQVESQVSSKEGGKSRDYIKIMFWLNQFIKS